MEDLGSYMIDCCIRLGVIENTLVSGNSYRVGLGAENLDYAMNRVKDCLIDTMNAMGKAIE